MEKKKKREGEKKKDENSEDIGKGEKLDYG